MHSKQKPMDLKRILKIIKDLFALEFDQGSFVLFYVKSLKIINLKKTHFFSLPLKYIHTKVLKNWVEFDEAAELLALSLRKAVLDQISSMQSLLATDKSTDHKAEAANLEAFFDELEEEVRSLELSLKVASSKVRDLFIHRLLALQEFIIKERSRKLLPLLSYLRLLESWNEKVESKRQDIFTKDLSAQKEFLKNAGIVLANLIQEKKTTGPWGMLLDIEGKSALFQEIAEKIIQTSLKEKMIKNPIERNKGTQELGLYKAYVTLLRNPKESIKFLSSLREVFVTKFEESLDLEEKSLIEVHFRKIEMEKRALLLKFKYEEREGLLQSIRQELQRLREAKEISFPETLSEIERTMIWPETLDNALKEKFIHLLRTIVKISHIRDNLSWQKDREIWGELFDLGLLTPTTRDLSNPTALFAHPKLIKTGEEIHLSITSEIARMRRDLMDIAQNIESYSDRLNNEMELQELKNAIRAHQKKMTPFVSRLIEEKGLRKSVIKEEQEIFSERKAEGADAYTRFEHSKESLASLAKKLNIDASPLYLKEEDLESVFYSLASPYMTEGARGKLPSHLSLLREEILKAIKSLQEMRISPLLGLAREKERLRAAIKGLEKILEPVNETMRFLRNCKELESRKSRLIMLTRKKKVSEEGLEKIEKELNEAEKDLYILEGVEAALVELSSGRV